jgi:hypothetical protein
MRQTKINRIVCWAGSFAIAAAVSAALGGCGQMDYQGTNATARTFHPDPGPEDVYVGADAEFAVTDPAEKRRLANQPTAQSDTFDAQKSQREFDQSWEQATAPTTAPSEQSAGEANADPAPVDPPTTDGSETDGSENDGSENEPTLKPDYDRGYND